MTVNDELRQLYEHADEAEAFEHAAAEAVSAPLREQLIEVSRWLAQRWVAELGSLEAEADADRIVPILAELRQRFSSILLGSPNSTSSILQ